MRRVLFVPLIASVIVVVSCSAPPAPQPMPEDRPAPVAPSTPAAEPSIGTVRVVASALNVRRDPSSTGEVLAQVKKGDRLTLLANAESWMKVRLADGTTGWVASQHVTRDGGTSTASVTPRTRRRGGCPPDSEFRFIKTPTPSFSDRPRPGLVVVDANVDTKGNVTSTRVISNTTGDDALAALAEREIRSAKFDPPIRNCAPKAFIFTYKRSF